MSQSCKNIGNTAPVPLTEGKSRDTIPVSKNMPVRHDMTRLPMKCKNCGATLDEGALFCRKCGTAVAEKPAPKPVQTKRKQTKRGGSGASGLLDRILGFFSAVGEWFSRAFAWIGDRFTAIRNAKIWKNRRLLMTIGAALALLVLLIVVISCAASCRKPEKYQTPDEVTAAVVEALEQGDGEKLYRMSTLSEKALGVHTETFGAGDTPEAVMRGYYARLAGDLQMQLAERYGKEYRLEGQLTTKIVSDTSIYETNRALGLEAAEYAEISGPLSVSGETVTNIHIVAADVDGEWKLLVVYLY